MDKYELLENITELNSDNSEFGIFIKVDKVSVKLKDKKKYREMYSKEALDKLEYTVKICDNNKWEELTAKPEKACEISEELYNDFEAFTENLKQYLLNNSFTKKMDAKKKSIIVYSVSLVVALISMVAILFSTGVIKNPFRFFDEDAVLMIGDENVYLKEYNFLFIDSIRQTEYMMGLEQDSEEAYEYWNTLKDGKTNFEISRDNSFKQYVNLCVTAKIAENSGFSYEDESVKEMTTYFKDMFTGGEIENFYNFYNTDEASFDSLCKKMAITEALYKLWIEDGIIETSDESLAKEFEEKYFKAQHILITTTDSLTGEPLSDEEKAEKRKQAEDILKRVNSGEDFKKLAETYSEDPGKAQYPDGYVFTEKEMVEEFENATKALEIGSVSGIVETSYGYHIIKRLPVSYDADRSFVTTNFEQMTVNNRISAYIDANIETWKKDVDLKENKKLIEKLTLNDADTTVE